MLVKRTFFKRCNRITETKHFSYLFSCAKRLNSQAFSYYIKANNTGTPRLGVVIAKRNQKKAVARNRTKRIVRESFRCNQQLLSGLDIIVIAKRGIENIPALKLRQELILTWERLNQC